ncbi:hypothetical protein EVAR_63229_1 [Eumeta japonica]|uniref:Mariner Mos1 transposase n=1 Tax=Eumeta variegata TaxID=151549 RepID=A0A4C1Z5J1_EUMVA|nr:hypothetical protein EVAR_63229_1 [Eumeta japonica]
MSYVLITYDKNVRKGSWSKGEQAPQTTAKPGVTRTKLMLCVWWDWRGIIHRDFTAGLVSGFRRAPACSGVCARRPRVPACRPTGPFERETSRRSPGVFQYFFTSNLQTTRY